MAAHCIFRGAVWCSCVPIHTASLSPEDPRQTGQTASHKMWMYVLAIWVYTLLAAIMLCMLIWIWLRAPSCSTQVRYYIVPVCPHCACVVYTYGRNRIVRETMWHFGAPRVRQATSKCFSIRYTHTHTQTFTPTHSWCIPKSIFAAIADSHKRDTNIRLFMTSCNTSPPRCISSI